MAKREFLSNLRSPHSKMAFLNTITGVLLLVGGLYFSPWLRLNPLFEGHDMALHFFQRASPADVIYGEIIAILAVLLVISFIVTGKSRIWWWGTLILGVLGLTVVSITLIFDVIFATGRPFSRIPHNGWYLTFIGSIVLLATSFLFRDAN